MRRLVPLVVLALLAGTTTATAAPEPDGTLTLTTSSVRAGEPIEATYSTPRPNATNWLGLYTEPGNGPVNEEYVGPSLRWVYVPDASGTATLPTDGLAAGDYVVYALAEDGYAWLAQPVTLRITDGTALHFVTDRFDLRNARAGAPYEATVHGLARGDTEGLAFRKTGGADWLSVSADGALTGTPESAGAVEVDIEATNTRGDHTSATVRVEVRAPGTPLAPELRTMSFNLWHGGSQVDNGLEKQLRALLDSDVDVVGLQETDAASTSALADALGWDHHQAGTDLGVLSRYPIVERLPAGSGPLAAGTRVKVRIDEGQEVVLWNVHLGYTPYGPYDACFGQLSTGDLLANEESSGRTPQITAILTEMGPDLASAGATPVLLTGDFNAPSHLDWTPATNRCGYGDVPWPASVRPAEAGLRDSYRVAHPDPVAAPGTTWSPIYPVFTGGYGYDSHKGEPEPQDRIDFVYFSGPLSVADSAAVVAGDPAPVPDHHANEWPSDHAAVLTTFRTVAR